MADQAGKTPTTQDDGDDAGAAGSDSEPNWDDVIARIAEVPEDKVDQLEGALKKHGALGTRLLRTVRQSTILSEAEKIADKRGGADGGANSQLRQMESLLEKAAGTISRLQAQVDAREEEDLTPEQLEVRGKDRRIKELEAKTGEYEGVLTRGRRREAVDAILEFAVDDEEGLGLSDSQIKTLRETAADVIDGQGDPDVLKAQLLKFTAANRKQEKAMSKSEIASLRDEVTAIAKKVSGETETVTTSTGSETKAGGAMPFSVLEEKWLAEPAQYGVQYRAERKKLGMDLS